MANAIRITWDFEYDMGRRRYGMFEHIEKEREGKKTRAYLIFFLSTVFPIS